MYRTGKYTKQAKEVRKYLRELAKDGETMVATVMSRHGLKPLKAIRRRAHVKRALAAAAKAKEGEKA